MEANNTNTINIKITEYLEDGSEVVTSQEAVVINSAEEMEAYFATLATKPAEEMEA